MYGQEAILPIEVELSSLRVLVKKNGNVKEKLKQRILDLEKLTLNREAAMEHYVEKKLTRGESSSTRSLQ